MAKTEFKAKEVTKVSPMLGVYFGGKDDDLFLWKKSCHTLYGVSPSAFAKEAIREKIAREKGGKDDFVSLKQAVRLLLKHSDVLEKILSYVSAKKTVQISASSSNSLRQEGPTPQRADYISACRELGWERPVE